MVSSPRYFTVCITYQPPLVYVYMCVYIYNIHNSGNIAPKHSLINNKLQPREISEMQYTGACKGFLGLQSYIADSTFERQRKQCKNVAYEVIRQATYI